MEITSSPIVVNDKIPVTNKTEKKAEEKNVEVSLNVSIKKDDLKRAGVGVIAGAIPAAGVYLIGSSILKGAERMGDGGLGPAIMGAVVKQPMALAIITSSAASAYLGDGKAGKGALIGAATGAVSSVIPVLKYRQMPAIIAVTAVLGAVAGATAGAASSYISGKVVK